MTTPSPHLTTALAEQPRLIITAELQPVVGSLFQPTGFPNLGAARFERPSPDGPIPALIVESPQSLINHFEAVGWDGPNEQPVPVIQDLPWVRVVADDDRFLTSSRLEPHRLSSPYVREAITADGTTGTAWLSDALRLEAGRPLPWRSIYDGLLRIDPLTLLHGVFFSDKAFHGNPKVRRAISPSLEAYDVRPADSGGLKRDDVRFRSGKSTDDGKQSGGASDGYGFVPFSRTEWVADRIVFSAIVDLHQIRGYGFAPQVTELLHLIALWEVLAFLNGPLRLRSACSLEVVDGAVAIRGFEPDRVPPVSVLNDAIAARVPAAAGRTTDLSWAEKKKRKPAA